MECKQSAVTDWGLIASVVAVGIAAAGLWWTRRSNVLSPKRHVLRRLLGSRHLLTDAMAHHRGPGEPYTALNESAVAYYSNESVVRALKRYFAERSVGNLKMLIREMAKAARSSLDKFDDDFLTRTAGQAGLWIGRLPAFGGCASIAGRWTRLLAPPARQPGIRRYRTCRCQRREPQERGRDPRVDA